MLKTSTLPQIYRKLMDAPSIRSDRCAICSRAWPLNQHHMVWRSWGRLYDDSGREVPKPTIPLCGMGNVQGDADGIPYCHGKAHERRLHFKYEDGILSYLETERPTSYLHALKMDGWREVG